MNPGETIGRYTLKRRIASGGMAEIWLATTLGPAGFEKDVVIKRILPHLVEDRRFVEMFIDEARLAAGLTHPNIVQIFDLGESDGGYFIAMEFIDGFDLETLEATASSHGIRIPAEVAARIVADCCNALEYAHNFSDREGRRVGLVHRDVSPQNVLISRDGVVKLVDFGVAKAATSQHKTQTGAIKGKLAFMSPEQIQARPLDGRSDLFSLGIVLYQLLTGQRPFGHESELLAVSQILHDPPRPVREIRGDMPAELEDVVMRALAKQPKDRFQSASEMQMALEQFLRSRGVLLTQRDLSRFVLNVFSASPDPNLVVAGAATQAASPSGPTPTVVEQAATILAGTGAAPSPGSAPATAPGGRLDRTLGAVQRSRDAVPRPDNRPPRSPDASVEAPGPTTPARPGNAGRVAAALAAAAALCVAGFILWSTRDADPGTARRSGSMAPAPTGESAPAPRDAGVGAPATAGATTNPAGSRDVTGSAGSGQPPAPIVPTVPGAQPVAPDVPKPVAEPASTTERRAEARTGTIRVGLPGSAAGRGRYSVFVDGKRVGSAPEQTQFRASPGQRLVEVRGEGRVFSRVVRVEEGKTVSVMVTF